MVDEETNKKVKTKLAEVINEKNIEPVLPADKYAELVAEVKRAKANPNKTPRDKWLLETYEVVELENTERLITPLKASDTATFIYMTDDDLFNIIYDTSLAMNHGQPVDTKK